MIVGVDPGETTGIFVHDSINGHRWYQPTFWSALEIISMVHEIRPITVLVVEGFNVFQKQTSHARKNIQWPLDIIGAVKWFAHTHDITVVTRWNHTKNRVPDELLESRGMLKKPKHVNRHANDAARHVLGFILGKGNTE